MQYLAYSQPSTSVSHAAKADFLVPGVPALLQAKSNRLEVYTLESTGLRLAITTPVFGTILDLAPVRLRAIEMTCIAVLTLEYKLFVLSFQNGEATTLASHSVEERGAVPSADLVSLQAERDVEDSASPTKYLALHAFNGLIRIILLEEGTDKRRTSSSCPDALDLSRGFTARIPELLLTSMCLLPGEGARMATIHTDRHGQRILQVRSINVKAKSIEAEGGDDSVPTFPRDGVTLGDPSSQLILPVHSPRVVGLVVVGQDSARFFHTAAPSVVATPRLSDKPLTAEPSISEMQLDDPNVSPPTSSSKGKGKAREMDPTSPTRGAHPPLSSSPPGGSGHTPTSPSKTRRRSSAASNPMSPKNIPGALPATGNKRKLSESAQSSGRGKPIRERSGFNKIIECSLPLCEYTAFSALRDDPLSFLLVDGWGVAYYLRIRLGSKEKALKSPEVLATSPKLATSPTARRSSRSGSTSSVSSIYPRVHLACERIAEGRVSSPTCLVELGDGFVFVGSHFGDSMLVRLPTEAHHNRSEQDMALDSADDDRKGLEIISTFTNLAPILDFCTVSAENGHGPTHLVTCSGGRNDGSLRIVRHGVGLTELAALDMQGIQRIWSVSDTTSGQDLLVLSYLSATRVLAFSREVGEDGEPSIEELTSYGGFDLGKATILAHSYEGSAWQATSQGVFGTHGSWNPAAAGQITLAAACEDFILTAMSGGKLSLLKIINDGTHIEEVAGQTLPQEVASLDLSEIITHDAAHIIASVGLWNIQTVSLLSVPTLETLQEIDVGTSFLLRSVISCTLSSDDEDASSASYLFVGLGDGTLVSFHYEATDENALPKIDLSSKKTLTLGTRPIAMSRITTAANAESGARSSPAIFIASDRSTIVSRIGGRVVYASVNTKDVISVTPLSTPVYTDALVLCTPDTLQIGRIDSLQKLHVRTLRLGEEAPRRICHSESLKAFGVIFLKETPNRGTGEFDRHSTFKILDDTTFEVSADFSLEEREEARSVACLSVDPSSETEQFLVGTAFIDPEDSECYRGRLILYEYAGEKSGYRQIAELDTRGAVHAITGLTDNLVAIASNSEVLVLGFDAEKGSFERIASWGASYITYSLISSGNLLLSVDPLRSITLMRFDPETRRIIDVAKEWSSYGAFAAQFLRNGESSGTTEEGDGKGGTQSYSLIANDLDRNLLTVKMQKHGVNTQQNSDILKVHAMVHLGEIVNKIIPGSIVPRFATTGGTGVISELVFCTSSGSIGIVVSLDAETSQLLSNVERNMRKVAGEGVGGLTHADYRAFKSEYKRAPAVGFIDGSFLEELPNLSSDLVDKVMDGAGNEHERITGKTRQEVISLIEELQRIH